MKQLLFFLFTTFTLLLGGRATSQAQTTLSAGDIAFIGIYTDGSGGNTDAFTFITLKAITTGTVIYFTDNGWDGTTPWVASPSEVHWAWTSPAGGLPIGTIVNVTWSTGNATPTVSLGTASTWLYGTSWHFPSSGDNLLAYQISSWSGARPTSPTFIAALDFDFNTTFDNYDGWSTGAVGSGYEDVYCALPVGLTNGTNCVALFNSAQTYEYDNLKYNGTLTGSASTIRTAINNFINWTGSDDTPFDITSAAFPTPSIITDTPIVTSISPSSGPATGGTSVVITGTNLTSASAVNFGNTAATIMANTATSITAISPARSVGVVDVTVTTAGGTSATNSGDQFTYINPLPANPTSISASVNPVCNGFSTLLTANGVDGTVYWYTGSCGGTQVSTGNTYSVSPSSTTMYYARNYENSQFSAGCASLEITVNQPSFVPPAKTLADLLITSEPGATIKWYNAASGGTSLPSSTPITSTGTTYYASQTVNGAESIGRVAVTAMVETTPCEPTGAATQSYSSGATVANLQATGTSIRWYSSSTGGTALSATNLLANGNHYWATQTVDCTESATRMEVTVTIY